MNSSARRSMSSSPPGDADAVPPLDVLVRISDEAPLLVRDTLLVVAVPMLVDLDVLDEAGEAASSRLGLRGLRLSARPGCPRAMEERSIHRVALKESRNRTFLIAARSAPRIDDRFLDGSGVDEDGETAMSLLLADDSERRARLVTGSNARRGLGMT
jgi:hypothetical protein